MHHDPLQSLLALIEAIQSLQALQNRYLTHPSKRHELRPLLAQAASQADEAAQRYHDRRLKDNTHPTPHDHAGAVIWRAYTEARQAFRDYKAQKSRTTKQALKQAEHALKKRVAAVEKAIESDTIKT